MHFRSSRLSPALLTAGLLASCLLLGACQSQPSLPEASSGSASPTGVDTTHRGDTTEQEVRLLPLSGPLSSANAELSGLTWHGDDLILLPQHPLRMANEDSGTGRLFVLPKARIEAFLAGRRSAPLTPRPIVLTAPHLSERTPTYQGCEAIAFRGDRAFMTVEATANAATGAMRGYLLSGRLRNDTLHLQTKKPTALPPQTTLVNMSYEAILALPDRAVALYEANGKNVNPMPQAFSFRFRSGSDSLYGRSALPFPTLEYRLTDATALDAAGRFWVMNYFFPGERQKLRPAPDSLSAIYGTGPTRRRGKAVERLVEFELTEEGIQYTDAPPLLLRLFDEDPRNWEGAVRFESQALGPGFLLATDQYPTTLLGYVSADSAISSQRSAVSRQRLLPSGAN